MDLSNKDRLALEGLKQSFADDEMPSAYELAFKLTWSLEEAQEALDRLVEAGLAGVIPPGGRNPTATQPRYVWTP